MDGPPESKSEGRDARPDPGRAPYRTPLLDVHLASGRLDLRSLAADGSPVPSDTLSQCRLSAPLGALAFTRGGTVLAGSERGVALFWSGERDDDPLYIALPNHAAIADLTATDEHVLALTRGGDVWYAHATFDAAGLRRLLDARARLCIRPADRVTLKHLKSRHGEARDIALSFDRPHQRFTPAAPEPTPKPSDGGKLQAALRAAWASTPPAGEEEVW